MVVAIYMYVCSVGNKYITYIAIILLEAIIDELAQGHIV
jgi:hypothetical protein